VSPSRASTPASLQFYGAVSKASRPSRLSRSLKIAPGDRCCVLNAPDGYLSRLQPLPEGASTVNADENGRADFVQLFAADRAQLERDFAVGFKALRPGGLLWVAYPSPQSGAAADLSRNHGWGAVHGAGLTATEEIKMDAAWDAVRFQPALQVAGSEIPSADLLPVGRRATTFFRAVRLVSLALFRLMFRFDVTGRERIPSTAYVLIANHLGWLDAVSLLLVFPPEPRIHYLADPTSMMKNRPLWALVRATGGIVPVDRAKRGDKLLFRHVQRCLEQGGVVALFPEGDFGPNEGELLPFKSGFARFAVEARVPVLPVGLAGMKDVWLGKEVFLRIGEPIPSSDRTVAEVQLLGEAAVRKLMPAYDEPKGRKPLRRWLTGLF
jgi:1-acyl-sn-glycerol-3-phosphate acyltransferase